MSARRYVPAEPETTCEYPCASATTCYALAAVCDLDAQGNEPDFYCSEHQPAPVPPTSTDTEGR